MSAPKQHGFTLIELVVVISLSSIIVGFMVMFIATPIETYMAQSRRAELVTSADMVANNMTSDLRAATTGSARYATNGTTTQVLEVTLPSGVPVAYICDSGMHTMQRYSNYAPDANFSNRDSDAELIGAGAQMGLLAQDVITCQIYYDATNPLHDKLVGLQMRLTRNGENLYVFRQFSVGS